MNVTRNALFVLLVAALAVSASFAAMKEVAFDGAAAVVEGAPFGVTPEFCVERADICPAGYVNACVVGAGHSEAIDVYDIVEVLCIDFASGDGFGEYEMTTPDGATLYGAFDSGTSGGNIPVFGEDPTQGPIALLARTEWWVEGGTGRLAGASSRRNPARVVGTDVFRIYLGGTIEIEKDTD